MADEDTAIATPENVESAMQRELTTAEHQYVGDLLLRAERILVARIPDLRARAEALRSEGADPGALLQAVRAAPVARGVLRRFAQLARTTLAHSSRE